MKIVEFETAKLAREKKFKNPTEGYYYPSAYGPVLLFGDFYDINCTYQGVIPDDKKAYSYDWNSHDNTKHDPEFIRFPYYAAPTQVELQAWLRDTFKIRLFVIPSSIGTFTFEIRLWDEPNNIGKWTRIGNVSAFDKFEQALEIGLQEALKLIK